jgi:heat shock protein HslJ
MRPVKRLLGLVGGVSACVLVACTAAPEATIDVPHGVYAAEWVSVGDSANLLTDVPPEFDFRGESLWASVSCNELNADYGVRDSQLVVSNREVTAMGCPQYEMPVQDALVRLVDSSPTFDVNGDLLTLTGDGVEARLRQKA